MRGAIIGGVVRQMTTSQQLCGPKRVAERGVCQRECVCASCCVRQLDKETVADHSSSAEGQMKEREEGEKSTHLFCHFPFSPLVLRKSPLI